MNTPSFEQLAECIRRECGLRKDKHIDPDTQFERDLGITGDDGGELLEAVEKQYQVEFTHESFGLEFNEYLFNSEGFDAFPVFIQSLFGKPIPEVRSFTVGELHKAVLKEQAKQFPSAQ
ncbi:DUF1493 family protein [Terracidiphilus gabretensis]|jgi:acyl carrier protein|uniref:DUF1493 family protein n=1 Tax=Terracidiphilus gabretensis TaxID=1577687 RepID=UPI00071B6A05|nr:DUF1493 family protein [Terracidiphilus gabretensis]